MNAEYYFMVRCSSFSLSLSSLSYRSITSDVRIIQDSAASTTNPNTLAETNSGI
jgi:hypothetical protein